MNTITIKLKGTKHTVEHGNRIFESTWNFDDNYIVTNKFLKDPLNKDVEYMFEEFDGKNHLAIRYAKGNRPTHVSIHAEHYAIKNQKS